MDVENQIWMLGKAEKLRINDKNTTHIFHGNFHAYILSFISFTTFFIIINIIIIIIIIILRVGLLLYKHGV